MTMSKARHTYGTFAKDCATLAKLALAGNKTKSWNPAAVNACKLSQQLAGVLERSQDMQMGEVAKTLGMPFPAFISNGGDHDIAIAAINETTHAKLMDVSDSLGVTDHICRYMNHYRKSSQS
jgi:hypothetical protein